MCVCVCVCVGHTLHLIIDQMLGEHKTWPQRTRIPLLQWVHAFHPIHLYTNLWEHIPRRLRPRLPVAHIGRCISFHSRIQISRRTYYRRLHSFKFAGGLSCIYGPMRSISVSISCIHIDILENTFPDHSDHVYPLHPWAHGLHFSFHFIYSYRYLGEHITWPFRPCIPVLLQNIVSFIGLFCKRDV